MVCSDLHFEGEGQGYRRRRLGQDYERGKVFARSRGLPVCDEWGDVRGWGSEVRTGDASGCGPHVAGGGEVVRERGLLERGRLQY